MSNKTNIQPLFNNVLIRPVQDSEKTTPSGIILPDAAKEKPQAGTVEAVGPGRHNDEGKIFPCGVKVGQKVLYKKWGGHEVKVENEEWLLVEEKDILAVIG
ncbi:co-chaperone GroES [Candidatus Roizmanbacteria bacterium]|nr:co-chaperone GroES [Candidatus Roizmanbacteria bacterium]